MRPGKLALALSTAGCSDAPPPDAKTVGRDDEENASPREVTMRSFWYHGWCMIAVHGTFYQRSRPRPRGGLQRERLTHEAAERTAPSRHVARCSRHGAGARGDLRHRPRRRRRDGGSYLSAPHGFAATGHRVLRDQVAPSPATRDDPHAGAAGWRWARGDRRGFLADVAASRARPGTRQRPFWKGSLDAVSTTSNRRSVVLPRGLPYVAT